MEMETFFTANFMNHPKHPVSPIKFIFFSIKWPKNKILFVSST